MSSYWDLWGLIADLWAKCGIAENVWSLDPTLKRNMQPETMEKHWVINDIIFRIFLAKQSAFDQYVCLKLEGFDAGQTDEFTPKVGLRVRCSPLCHTLDRSTPWNTWRSCHVCSCCAGDVRANDLVTLIKASKKCENNCSNMLCWQNVRLQMQR